MVDKLGNVWLNGRQVVLYSGGNMKCVIGRVDSTGLEGRWVDSGSWLK